ncbi:carbohydrate-binding module family 20 protein [Hebeloma cylindrosporum]|uniref:Glucoamylase n=1 Tax=Hebeloma cylindrosporum TaxID=76867 RepID=A0A0C3BHD6_HEBCY|nr:carbohydrate-binding module family 20 protein [Hebeloma cylindrosporum h7]
MRSVLLTGFAFCAAVFAQNAAVDKFVTTQYPISKAGVLANIGPSGSKSSGAKAGVVIASPSRSDPDYLFTWARDSGLVLKTVIDLYTRGEDNSLRTTIDQYVASQAIQQRVSNPSGSISTGGLGEPKFNIDLSAFTGGWGRPQRDGPALRATALIAYGNWLVAHSNSSYAKSTLWPIIKLDLDYVASTWNLTGFDLWEEVNSSSYFTSAVQHRALREGAAFATKIGQTSVVSRYNTQAANVLCFMQSYWNPTAGYMTSNTGGGRSGKDANTALASVHTFDPAAGCDPVTFQPCSDKALSSLKVYVDSFRSIYAINSGIPSSAAVATGRYSEDVYYGGNPWYLTTTIVAEQLYDALYVWKQQRSLTVTSTSLAFFQQLVPSAAIGTYPSTSATFTTLTNAVKNYADGFLAIVAKYTPSNGALAEQYTRAAGVPISARDLTWSYAASLTAFSARKGIVPNSWGAKGVVVPKVCGTEGGGTVQVTFKVDATTVYGENIFLTGSLPSLQNWSPDTALPLSSDNYPTWSITVSLPASQNFEYKFIRKYNSAITWESDPNRLQTTPASGTYTFYDTWR